MIEWASGESAVVTLRFLVYLDLLLLAGLAIAGRHIMPVAASSRLIAWLAVTGALLAIAQFLVTALAMVAGDIALLDGATIRYLALETPIGLSFIARILFLFSVAAIGEPRARILLAVAALATLAWSGHAGANEGTIGAFHRMSDILHLIAASIWLGTLVLLLSSLWRSGNTTVELTQALHRFSQTGTLIVGTLVVTGAVNLWAINGFDALPDMIATDYGATLGIKLALFAAMLGFAAINRYRLTPRLIVGDRTGSTHLRASVAIEIALAVGVILAVAILGTLTPFE